MTSRSPLCHGSHTIPSTSFIRDVAVQDASIFDCCCSAIQCKTRPPPRTSHELVSLAGACRSLTTGGMIFLRLTPTYYHSDLSATRDFGTAISYAICKTVLLEHPRKLKHVCVSYSQRWCSSS